MMKYNYCFEVDGQGKIIITGLPYATRYVELPRDEHFRKLYSYILTEIDMERAIQYLRICKTTEDPIIKDGLFKIAVVQYAKCFSSSNRGGRSQIEANKVYRGTSGDPIGCHQKFMTMRHKYFAHDENDYLQAQVGVLLNTDEKKYVGCLYPRKQSKFDYAESIDILLTLCELVKEWVSNEIDKALAEVEDNVKKLGFDTLEKYPDMNVSRVDF